MHLCVCGVEKAYALNICDCAGDGSYRCAEICGCVMCCDFMYVFAHVRNVSCMGILANFIGAVNMSNVAHLHELRSCLWQSVCGGDFPPSFR